MLVSLCSRRDNGPRKGSSEELQDCWGTQAARGDAFPCPATMSCRAVPPVSPWLFALFGCGVLVPSARGAEQRSFSEGIYRCSEPFVFSRKRPTAPSGRELTQGKRPVLVLCGGSAAEVVLTGSGGDGGLRRGSSAKVGARSHVLPVPGDGGLHKVAGTWPAALGRRRFGPAKRVCGGTGFGGAVAHET